jgi:predicted nucleic acid-binding Zn ribbon protein
MNRRRDPAPLGDVLKTILRQLGVRDLDTWQRIQREWPEAVPAPWNLQSRPLSLTDGVLVVEATTPAAIGVLRYGVGSLQNVLVERYGQGVVTEVKLRSPGPPGRA